MAEKVTIMVLKVDLQCSRCYKKVKKVLCKFPQIRDQVYDEKANTVTITVVCCSPEKIRDKLCCKGGGSIKSIEIKEPPKPKPPETKPAEKPKEPEKKPDKPKEPEKKPADKPKEPEKKPDKPKEPEKKPDKPKEAEKKLDKPKEPEKKPDKPKELEKKPEKPKDAEKPPAPKAPEPAPKAPEPAPPPVQCYTPSFCPPPPPGFCCGECYMGFGGGPCYHGRGGPPPPPAYVYGRPVYDSWGGGGGHRTCHVTRCDYFSEENPQGCTIM